MKRRCCDENISHSKPSKDFANSGSSFNSNKALITLQGIKERENEIRSLQASLEDLQRYVAVSDKKKAEMEGKLKELKDTLMILFFLAL